MFPAQRSDPPRSIRQPRTAGRHAALFCVSALVCMAPRGASAEPTRLETSEPAQLQRAAEAPTQADSQATPPTMPGLAPANSPAKAPSVLADREALLNERAYWLRRRNGAVAAGILIPVGVIMMASSAAPFVSYRDNLAEENAVFSGYPNYTENPQEGAKSERIRAAGRGLAITGALVFTAGLTAAILGTSGSRRARELYRIDKALASLASVARLEPWMQLGRSAGGTAGGVTGTLRF
jgi:hypothetical protein